ncbi:MAG: MptD family putative ECF transporter S component [Eubacteriales bacterium]
MESKKIEVKDLVNVGVFTLLNFVVFFVAAMTGMIPVMAIWYPLVTAFLGGIPCILFFTKIEKFGLVTIMGLLLGLSVFLIGQGWYALITGVVFGVIADSVLKAGNYKSWKNMMLAYCIFSEWIIGTQMVMYLTKDAYLEPFREQMGDEFVDSLSAMLQTWTPFAVMLGIFIVGIVGAFLGKSVLKKHFERAGIV